MSAGGRGRGYLGRHHLRDEPVRPGDPTTPASVAGDKPTPSADRDNNSGDKPSHSHSGERVAHGGDKTTKSATPRSADKGREKSTRTIDKSAVLNKEQPSAERNHSGEMTTHAGDKSTRSGDASARSGDPSNALSEEVQCLEPPKDVHHSASIVLADANSRLVAEGAEEARLGADDAAALAELMRVEEPHRPLVAMLEQFSPGEDGIAFNRKLREFEATLTALCSDDAQLQLAFASLRGAALGSAALARKLASVGASFTRQQRQNVLRMALLNVMQSTFAKLDVLERASPQILTNAATLMGDYFMEARLGNGSKVQLLCAPLLQYLRSLLACADRRAHRALATQLMQNGRELLASNAPELEELSVSVRIRLLSAPPACLIWLLLSADLCINKFLPLPAGLQGFYASNLDLVPEPDSYSEVSYGSWRKPDEEEELSPANASDESSARKPRPILGAGAALTRQNNSFPEVTAAHDSQDVWNKSALAKRYDLNSWRQQEPGDKDDSQEEFPSADKFIPSQQFVPNEGSGPWSGPPPAGPPAHYAKFNHAAPPFAPPAFTTPPPFVPERTVAAVPAPNEKFSNPPPFLPERYDKRPPENWRRERADWTRQKSEEPAANGEAERRGARDGSGDARAARREAGREVREGREGRREGRPRPPRRDDADEPPAPPPAPARRPEKRMDVPRSRKYWDHDDRLDKDYNS